jgi:tubulin polyglutamylase TTLL6/13
MRKIFPKDYNFYPKTWLLPADLISFRKYKQKCKKNETFIVKPEASS